MAGLDIRITPSGPDDNFDFSRPPRASFLGQLGTMLRRNLLLKRRSKKMTVAEIVIPCIFLMEFAALGGLMTKFNIAYPATTEYTEEPFSYPGINFTFSEIYPVGCAPDSPTTRQIMTQAAEYWNMMNSSSTFMTLYFPSEAAMERFYLNASTVVKGAGVVFSNENISTLNYTLRYPSELMPPSSKPYYRTNTGCRRYETSENDTVSAPYPCITVSYALSGFTSLQNVLTAAYTKIRYNITTGPLNLSTKMIPDPPTVVVQGGAPVAAMPASMMSNLIGFFVIFLVIFVVTEKEKQHIASMEIMGLRPAVYWISWVLLYALIMVTAAVAGLILSKALNVWPESSFGLLLIDCVIYGASMIALGFCVAPLFHRPLIAGLVTYTLIAVFGFLYMLETFLPSMPNSARWALALLSPTAFFMTMSRVAQAETSGFGIGFGNALADSDQSFTFGHALIMLSVDVILYSLLAVYLEKVFPSDDCPRERPWFFLLSSYWTRKPTVLLDEHDVFLDTEDIEAVTEDVRSRVAISTHGLRKRFPGPKGSVVAVHGFTYEMYEDEILAILGHNGAGKTTLINMITGMLAPSSGRAFVYGNDVTNSEELDRARTMIGICPQHDVLFDTFTVREHIDFYARLKGFSADQARIEYERIIDQIGLRTHANVQAQKLSGGQKRRLSIAIAVVGNPKILILDEPTSGVDPYSRRFLWDMIRDFRKGRCIIITTQSMQEADVFADRKLIISKGKLRCAGTSLFLKNRFGLGYHLTMSVDRDFDETEVEKFVTSRLLGAFKARAHAGELSFVLPKSGVAQFPTLFDELDNSLPRLKIRTYGVSLSTMEEIFLKLADESTEEVGDPRTVDDAPLLPPEKPDYAHLASTVFAPPLKGAVSCWRKFLALCTIRFLLLFRSRLFFIFGFVIPFMMVVMNGILSLLAQDYVTTLTSTDALNINGLTEDFRGTGAKFFYSNGSDESALDSLIGNLSAASIPFEPANYSSLLSVAPHFAGFIFRDGAVNGSKVKNATICYNGSAIHSIPYLTNVLLNTNFLLQSGINETFNVTSHPFPAKAASHALLVNFGFGAFLIGLAVAMIPGVYGIDVCRDRQLKIRSQIRMTGCSTWLYWGSAFMVHLLQFTATFIMIIALSYAFRVSTVTDAIGCVLVLFALHAPAIILFSYCISFIYKKFESAAVGIPFPMAMVAFVCYFIVLMLDSFGETETAKILHYVLVFAFPFYGFFGGMVFVQKIGVENAITSYRGGQLRSFFDWDTNIPVVFVAHAVHIPLLILFVICLECRYFNQSYRQFFGGCGVSLKMPTDFVEVVNLAKEDDDVQRERSRVKLIKLHEPSTYAIVLHALWKSFAKRSFCAKGGSCLRRKRALTEKVAVKNVSLLLPKGEVFGLLGPNGAGKTTTLSMITGEVTPSSGDIHVNGYNMHSETLSAIETMGSCPQTDTLWDDITMEEHLKLFAILNDLPPARSRDSIKIFSEGLQITEHMSKKASALSGGTKRKLTFVISMIGNPPLVLLDEPSTGMDPQSKRNLWDMIMQSFIGDRGAILTTHSMEEADALCDRIGIIVKGELQCLGSSQHLKDKFGSGYVLEMKLGSQADGRHLASAVRQLKAELAAVLPGFICIEEFYNRLVFAAPKNQISSLGAVFAGLDKIKQELNLEEYSFSQTTIEQVFLHFAKMQENPETPIVAASSAELDGENFINVDI